MPAEPVARVVDSTAAGDSFNAGYLAARLAGAELDVAAMQGHRIAARVIGHPGAIIPPAAMADLMPASVGGCRRAQSKGITSWRCSPRPSTPTRITLPGLRKIGSGLCPMPTPGGVPVEMMSPGKSVM